MASAAAVVLSYMALLMAVTCFQARVPMCKTGCCGKGACYRCDPINALVSGEQGIEELFSKVLNYLEHYREQGIPAAVLVINTGLWEQLRGRVVPLSNAFSLQPHFLPLFSCCSLVSWLPALNTALFHSFISWIYFLQQLCLLKYRKSMPSSPDIKLLVLWESWDPAKIPVHFLSAASPYHQ